MSDDHSFHAGIARRTAFSPPANGIYPDDAGSGCCSAERLRGQGRGCAGEHRQRQDRRFCAGLSAALENTKFQVQSLVLCPTRSWQNKLQKLSRVGQALGQYEGDDPMWGCRHWPADWSLQHSAHVVVGTPGRVLKHLQKGLTLQGLNALVLDEADRMLDMGFEEEIDAIFAYLPSPRQNLLFSATFPDEVAHVVKALAHTLSVST